MGRTKHSEGRTKLKRMSLIADAKELRDIWDYAKEEENRLGQRLAARLESLAGDPGGRGSRGAARMFREELFESEPNPKITYWRYREAADRHGLKVRYGEADPALGYTEVLGLLAGLRPETRRLEERQPIEVEAAVDEEMAVHRRFAAAVKERHFLMFCKRFGVPFEPTPDGGRSQLRWHSLEELERRCKILYAYLNLWDSLKKKESPHVLEGRLERVREVDDGVRPTDGPREALSGFLERMIALRCRPRLDLEEKKLWFQPMDPLGAVYLNFAKEVTGELREPITCTVCGDWFSPRDARQTVCSGYCKLKRARAKAKAKEAPTS